jgi:peptide/nickel transport system permease protein
MRSDAPAPQPEVVGRTPWQLAWMRLRNDKIALGSAVFIFLLIAFAFAAPLIAQLTGHGPNEQFRETGLSPAGIPMKPSKEFLLGTDGLGRDLLVRIAYGARISLFVGIVATAISVIVGLIVGTIAGFYKGWIDTVLSRITDVVLGFPFLLSAIALVSVFSPGIVVTLFVIIFFSWTYIARIVRGQVLSVREKEFVEAARSLGASDLRIMVRDVLPNVVAPVIVYATLMIPTVIVLESTLSFLGLGIVPPTPSWGGMIDTATDFYQIRPTGLIFPSLFLFATTLAFNLFGDGLRDALDPGSERAMAK